MVEIIKDDNLKLFKVYADITSRIIINGYETYFILACRYIAINIVEYLLQFDIHHIYRNEKQHSGMFIAICSNNNYIFDLLLRKKFPIEEFSIARVISLKLDHYLMKMLPFINFDRRFIDAMINHEKYDVMYHMLDRDIDLWEFRESIKDQSILEIIYTLKTDIIERMLVILP